MGKDFDNPWGIATKKGEIRKMSSVIEEILEEGREEGRIKGREEGMTTAMRRMLDVLLQEGKFSCEEMAKAVELTAGRAKLEASGNVTEETIADIARTGVDIISLGALTHSVQAFDISMKMVK